MSTIYNADLNEAKSKYTAVLLKSAFSYMCTSTSDRPKFYQIFDFIIYPVWIGSDVG